MKKLFLAVLAFGLYNANSSAQSEAVKQYAKGAADVYCTCDGMVKVVDLQIAVLDQTMNQADANAKTMELITDLQECSYKLNEYMLKLEPTTAAQEQAELELMKVLNKKYPECAKKIARLSGKN